MTARVQESLPSADNRINGAITMVIPRQPEMKRDHLPLSGTTIDEGSGTTEGAKPSPSPADVDAAGNPYSGNVIDKRNLLVMLPVSGTAGFLWITALGQQKGHLLILMLLVICVAELLLMAPEGRKAQCCPTQMLPATYREVALLVTVLALGKERVAQEVEIMLALVHLKERRCSRD